MAQSVLACHLPCQGLHKPQLQQCWLLWMSGTGLGPPCQGLRKEVYF